MKRARPALATACGKVILLGEHAVVYGEPALAVPLSELRLSVVLGEVDRVWSPPTSSFADLPGPAGEEVDLPSQQPLDGMVTARMPALRRREEGAGGVPTLDLEEVAPLTIDLANDAPPGSSAAISRAFAAAAHALRLPMPIPVRVSVRAGGLRSGMGTSAALGTALARAILTWYGEPPDTERVLRAAGAVERIFHDEPSGIDHTVSTLELPVWFKKGSQPTPLEDVPTLHLVLLPRRSPLTTGQIVSGLRERMGEDPALARALAEMGRWTRDGRAAWMGGEMGALAEAMNRQQESLDRVGVVSELDREGVAAARKAGASAAKITGAGWSGTLLALVDESSARPVMEAWGGSALLLTVKA